MKISVSSVLGVSLMAIALSSCQSARLNPVAPAPEPVRPEPLRPAPVSPIQKAELPPPSTPETTDPSATDDGETTNDPTQFPDVPDAGEETADGSETKPEDGTDVAVANTGGSAITREEMIGSWAVSTGGSNCQMFITLTKGPSGYRAGTRGCPGKAADIKAWDVSNKQVVFTGSDGNVVARIYNSGSEAYDGQTTDGQALSLRR